MTLAVALYRGLNAFLKKMAEQRVKGGRGQLVLEVRASPVLHLCLPQTSLPIALLA
jgi:hypothetical protein